MTSNTKYLTNNPYSSIFLRFYLQIYGDSNVELSQCLSDSHLELSRDLQSTADVQQMKIFNRAMIVNPIAIEHEAPDYAWQIAQGEREKGMRFGRFTMKTDVEDW